MNKDDLIKQLQSYLEQESVDGGCWYRRKDNFVDGRINLSGIVNIMLEMCARICLEAGFDDMGLCAAELRKLIQ